MVESSGLLMSRNNAFATVTSTTTTSGAANGSSSGSIANTLGTTATTNTTTGGSGLIGASRCGVMETRVRGAWYRVLVTLESDYLSVSLDETCDPVDHTTTLNGTLG